MKVHELIAFLRLQDQEAEVHYPGRDGYNSYEIEMGYVTTATYGIATPNPRTVPVVVLATGMEEL